MGTVTTAILRLNVEGGSAVTTEVRKATADLKAAQKDIEKASVDAVTRIEAAQKAASERAKGRRRRDATETVRETVQAVGQQGAAYRQGAVVVERTEQLVTRSKLKELVKRGEDQKRFIEAYKAAHASATAALEAELGKRGTLSDRERRQVESLALAMVAAHDTAERRRTAASEREGKKREAADRARARAAAQFLRGAPTAAANAAGSAAAGFADYGDDLVAQRRAREQVEYRATQIASGDIGDVTAAPQLLAATENISRMTGIDPTAVVEAMSKAQASFSNLADAAERGVYLNRVLPMLAQAAVATNSSLEDMVGASGEYARQLGVRGEDVPAAIAQGIAEGRLGSVGFRDYASHAGAVLGSAGRTLSSAPEDAMRSRALAGGLFQFAGRAGGTGAEASTRARAFFDNLSSARGQRSLREGLGYNPFDERGQLATRRGETQIDAFQRVVQDAYRRSGGNAGRFLSTVAGNRTEAQALGGRLFDDLSRHGGQLQEFRANINTVMGATTEDAVGRPYAEISNTPLARRGREDVGRFWDRSGSRADFANASDRQQREFASAHPELAALATNAPGYQQARGLQNLANLAYGSAESSAAFQGAAPLPANATRAQRQAALALDLGVSEARRNRGAVAGMTDRAAIRPIIEQVAQRELARLQLADRTRASGGSVANISDEAINRFAAANAAALLQALRSAQFTVAPAPADAVHTATTNAGNGGR